MKKTWPLLLLIGLPIVGAAQAQLPADIDPVTLSRLPPVTPADLDEEGQRLLAERGNFRAGPGPTHVTFTVRTGATSAFLWATKALSARAIFSSRH